ncbi:nineteen complex-related protein 2-domain-containing protein [Exophiala viscosa]|uniref:Nineteen complex-related protein 2-domain-containing protein n=1 Tax=Exophiala viscosa TaxID=2486360 RepID=A0AAN6E6K2_9EURO|nr:nineteen complex-related protein 2-domain-containing protein [Exophiala viscosa]KAI1628147.1 nineteen complex-related protein 2-domain-containing protein [Exophiala viscosa]
MSLFSAPRRKPKRIISRDEPDTQPADVEEDSGPVVRRPTLNAPKTKSKLRVSFNPGEEQDAAKTDPSQDEEASIPASKPSRLGLSSAAQNALNRTTTRDRADIEAQDHDRPSYSKAYLDELRNSTPSTPQDLSSRDSPSLDLIDPSSTNTALDLESKFGKAAISGPSSSRIPTTAEIKEKKERRARLAKEQAANAITDSAPSGEDFISLEDYDSDGEFKPRRMQVGSYTAPTRDKDTRLVPDDEDIAEGFDEFVEDAGRVSLSRKSQREQTKKEREAIRTMIDHAEGSDDQSDEDQSDDSDYDRHREYESAQTHRGMDGLSAHAAHTRQANRPRQPRETTPIPKLSVGLARLRDMVSHLEFEKARIEKRRADIARERLDIKESQAHIQTSLEEAGNELERVTREHLAAAASANGTSVDACASNGQPQPTASIATERGLESFGYEPDGGAQ